MYRYLNAAAAVTVVALGALAFVMRKRKLSCGCYNNNTADDVDDDAHDAVFEMMSTADDNHNKSGNNTKGTSSSTRNRFNWFRKVKNKGQPTTR
jgi:hypothetical protein